MIHRFLSQNVIGDRGGVSFFCPFPITCLGRTTWNFALLAIIIVTHNMQQASRISDHTAFFNAEAVDKGKRVGYLVETDLTQTLTQTIFSSPRDACTRDDVSGRFG